VGPKTYGKGCPDMIARLQVHVSGVWQRLWLLAIQLMTFTLLWPISTLITEKSWNVRDVCMTGDCFLGPGMCRRMTEKCYSTNMRLRDHGTTFLFLFLMQVAMSGTPVPTPPSLDGLGWKQFLGSAVRFTKEPRGPSPSFSRPVPLGVNKSGKGERYVSD
jgi:hypothetical protein